MTFLEYLLRYFYPINIALHCTGVSSQTKKVGGDIYLIVSMSFTKKKILLLFLLYDIRPTTRTVLHSVGAEDLLTGWLWAMAVQWSDFNYCWGDTADCRQTPTELFTAEPQHWEWHPALQPLHIYTSQHLN